MGYIVSDPTSLAYQPKPREGVCSPEETCDFCTIRATNQLIQLTHENWTKMMTINLLLVQTALPILKMKMINL